MQKSSGWNRVLLSLILTIGFRAQAYASPCDDNLKKPRLTKENCLPGAMLEVRPEVKCYLDDGNYLFVMKSNMLGSATAKLAPGETLEVIQGPKKVEGANLVRVRLASGEEGVAFWSVLKQGVVLTREGTAEPKQTAKPQKLKFPTPFSAANFQKGLSANGRKLPAEGDTVYIHVTNRIMTPNTVGKVIRILPEASPHGGQLIEIERLGGGLTVEHQVYCSPLTAEEIQQVRDAYKLGG